MNLLEFQDVLRTEEGVIEASLKRVLDASGGTLAELSMDVEQISVRECAGPPRVASVNVRLTVRL